ncbi:MAG: fibronectin type III domain-containing protein, partial [Clostridiales bacterium]|nr:fibronectin type III domain-containing protein [Clostridiales bacterium]
MKHNANLISKPLSLLLALCLTLGMFASPPIAVFAANNMPLGFSANPTSVDFGSVTPSTSGYTLPAARDITAGISYGAGHLGMYNFDAALTGANTGAFTFAKGTWPYVNHLDPGGSVTVTVQPRAYLAAGSFSATITFTGNSDPVAGLGTIYTFDIPVTFTVTDPSEPAPSPRPNAPVLESAVPGDQLVTLDWKDAVPKVDSYRIYANGTLLANDITATAYTVRNLTNATVYTFTVRSVLNGVESVDSNSKIATPEVASQAPAAPVLHGTAGDGCVDLWWDRPDNTQSFSLEYFIEPNTSNTKSVSIADGSQRILYKLTGLTNGSNYRIRVRGYNSAGYSSYSDMLSLTPVAPGSGGWMPEDNNNLIRIDDNFLANYADKTGPKPVVTLTEEDTNGVTTIVVDTKNPFVLAGNRSAGYTDLAVTCHVQGVDLTVRDLKLTCAPNHGKSSLLMILNSPSALHFTGAGNSLTLEGSSVFTG